MCFCRRVGCYTQEVSLSAQLFVLPSLVGFLFVG